MTASSRASGEPTATTTTTTNTNTNTNTVSDPPEPPTAANSPGPAPNATPTPAATETPTGSAGPLAGVTVLDLSVVGPAARCTRALADYGADVVKVAPPAGRGPAQATPPPHAYSGGRGMRRVEIDLRSPEGVTAFLALASRADVVVESFRPGVVERLGIGYENVRAVNPGIVYCSTTGYGRHGERAGWAGHDIDYLAVGGYLHAGGRGPDGTPVLPGATVADVAAGGLQAAVAVLAALHGRATTGQGAHVDVSVADGVLWMMSLPVDESLATGAEPGPGHDILSGRYACYGVYRAGDDRFLAVGAIEAKFFANLCRALDCERWVPHQLDDDAQAAIRADFAAVFATRSRDEWVERLAGADTCVAPVLSAAEAAEAARSGVQGRVVRARSATGEEFDQLGRLLAGAAPVGDGTGSVVLPDPSATATVALLESSGVDPGLVASWVECGAVA